MYTIFTSPKINVKPRENPLYQSNPNSVFSQHWICKSCLPCGNVFKLSNNVHIVKSNNIVVFLDFKDNSISPC